MIFPDDLDYYRKINNLNDIAGCLRYIPATSG